MNIEVLDKVSRFANSIDSLESVAHRTVSITAYTLKDGKPNTIQASSLIFHDENFSFFILENTLRELRNGPRFKIEPGSIISYDDHRFRATDASYVKVGKKHLPIYQAIPIS